MKQKRVFMLGLAALAIMLVVSKPLYALVFHDYLAAIMTRV